MGVFNIKAFNEDEEADKAVARWESGLLSDNDFITQMQRCHKIEFKGYYATKLSRKYSKYILEALSELNELDRIVKEL